MFQESRNHRHPRRHLRVEDNLRADSREVKGADKSHLVATLLVVVVEVEILAKVAEPVAISPIRLPVVHPSSPPVVAESPLKVPALAAKANLANSQSLNRHRGRHLPPVNGRIHPSRLIKVRNLIRLRHLRLRRRIHS